MIHSLRRLFIPDYCVVCDNELLDGEEVLCTSCIQNFPVVRWSNYCSNPMLDVLRDGGDVERACCCYYYRSSSPVHNIIVHIKYHHRPLYAMSVFLHFGKHLIESDFFEGIDAMVPIPLAHNRYRQRGYNQAEWVCRGINSVISLPIITGALVRTHSNTTQTHMASGKDRQQNVVGIFDLARPEFLRRFNHVLLVDDVCTTGSTLCEAIRTIQKIIPTLRISVFTLGWSGE